MSRDGFCIAGGGGIVVLEELEHAKARGAEIYAELVGYAANSDGYDMVAPSGVGGQSSWKLLWRMLPDILTTNPLTTSIPTELPLQSEILLNWAQSRLFSKTKATSQW